MKTLPNKTAFESAPSTANNITKPAVYLAGKIGKNDWRKELIPNLPGHLWRDGPIQTPTYSYVGPFFVNCDHECTDGPNTHGAASVENSREEHFTRAEIVDNNNAALRSANLIFAYISETDAFGTFCEIGYALALGEKRIVLCFALGVAADDFWYAAQQCRAVHISVRPCCLKQILADEISSMMAMPRRRRAPC